jgi:hypothetical protein
MLTFLWGASALGCWVIGLFFLRFWRNTRDRLFAFFAAAFWVLGLSWVALVVVRPSDEARHIIYLVRVVAFLLLSYGIIDKNITAKRK